MMVDQLLLTRLKGYVRSNRLRFLFILLADLVNARHLIVRLDPAMACNLRCAMCGFSDAGWRQAHPSRRLSAERIARIADMFFPTALQLYIGCGAEPTTYRGYPEIVRLAKDKGIPFVSLVTNGQLLTAEDLARAMALGLDEIVISVHGTTRESYETFMTGARFDTLVDVLAMIAAAKRAGNTDRPRLRINYTVNPDNLDELERFFDVFEPYGVQVLQVRPVIDLGATRYRNKGLDTVIDRYRRVMATLHRQCATRRVALLANLNDPTYRGSNTDAAAYLSVLRVISPDRVWREDFDPETTSYQDFKRHIGYRRNLVRQIIVGTTAVSNQPLASSDLL